MVGTTLLCTLLQMYLTRGARKGHPHLHGEATLALLLLILHARGQLPRLIPTICWGEYAWVQPTDGMACLSGTCVGPYLPLHSRSTGQDTPPLLSEGDTGSLGRTELEDLILTLVLLGVELVELLRELSQRLLNGLWAGHRQGKPSFEVLHLVHHQQGPVVGPGTERREESDVATLYPRGARLHPSTFRSSGPQPELCDGRILPCSFLK